MTSRRHGCGRGRAAAAAALSVLAVATVSCGGGGGAPAITPIPRGPYVSVDVGAGSTVGTINQKLIGVDGPGPAGAAGYLRAIGVHWVRTDVSFEATTGGRPVYDCATGAWNPAVLDKRVSAIRALGGTPLEIVDYSPACLTADPTAARAGNAPPDAGGNGARWDALVTAMAVHEMRDESVRYFEVWNEPDWVFFTGGLAGYLQLYADTARSIEAAARQVGVSVAIGGPALADVLDVQNQSWLEPFLHYVVANNLPLDFLSWHSYANDPYAGPAQPGGAPLCLGRPAGPGANLCYYNPNLDERTIAAEVVRTRADLDAYPSLHPLLIVDEWNLNGEYDPRQDQTFDAAYTAAVLESAQSVHLDGMCFFDVANSPSNAAENWGMLDARLRPKAVYRTFAFWHDLGRRQVAVSIAARSSSPQVPAVANSDADGRVGAVASVGNGGKVGIVLYDFKPYDSAGNYGGGGSTSFDRRVVVTVRGLGAGAYRIERHGIDGRHDGTLVDRKSAKPVSGSIRTTFTIPGEGVAFVTLTPRT